MVFLGIGLLACTLASGASDNGSARAPDSARLIWSEDAQAVGCPVTPPITAPEPTPAPLSPVHRDPLPTERWHRSPDGAVWTPASHLADLNAGRMKVLWIKPVGARLEIRGRRLDSAAPPLEAELREGYPGDYQSSVLVFPTGGCWEIEARVASGTDGAAGHALRVVAYVRPSRG